jgi:hypothetical protein
MTFDRRFLAALFVTMIILGLYAAVILGIAPVPADDMKETLKMSVVAVISYWIGSSSGSAAKDQTAQTVAGKQEAEQ